MPVVLGTNNKGNGLVIGRRSSSGARRKKKDNDSWLPNAFGIERGAEGAADFVGRSASDVKNMVSGIFTGPVELYRAVDRGHGKEAFKAILDTIKHGAVGELAQGNFEKAGREAWEHPVNTLLDVATVGTMVAAPFTGGASLALSAGAGGARSARVLQALSGLKKVDAAEAAQLPKHHLRVKGGKTYARMSRDWRYHGRPLDANIAPEVLPRNIMNRWAKQSRMRAREIVAPGSVAKKVTRAAEKNTFRQVATGVATLSSKFDSQLESLSKAEQGLIHVALSTAAPDPIDALRAFRKHTDEAIKKEGLTPELEAKQALYSKAAEPELRRALRKPEFQAAVNTARKMSHEAAVMQASDFRHARGPEKMLEAMLRESKLLGSGAAHFDGKAIRSHTNVGGEFKQEIDFSAKSVPDTYKKTELKNIGRGRDETNPQIYKHQYIGAAERHRTAPAVVKAFNLAQPVRADKVSKRNLRAVNADMAEHITGLRDVIRQMPKELQETAQARAILDAAKKIDDLADGDVLALPRYAYNKVHRHMQNTSDLALRFPTLRHYDNATKVWRAAVLNARPAWMVNNVIGSLVLLGLSHGPRGLYEAARSTKVGRRKGIVPVGLQPSKRGDLVKEYAPDMEIAGFAEAQARHIFGAIQPGTKLHKIVTSPKSAAEKMGAINTALESPARRGAWLAEAGKAARIIQRNAKKQGNPITKDEAMAAVLADQRTMDAITETALRDMIDFRSLGDEGRQIWRRAFPFIGWMTGISRRALEIFLEQPTKARALAALSQYGLEENQEGVLGDMPSFLRGAIDAGKGSDDRHRKILTTQGWNPFSTVGDIAGQIEATLGGKRTFGGENTLSQLNPLLRAPIEAYANRDLFYGSPLHYDDGGTFLGDYVSRLAGGTPQAAALKKWRQAGSPDASQRLFTPSRSDIIANYLGLPRKDVNVGVARRRRREERLGPTELG